MHPFQQPPTGDHPLGTVAQAWLQWAETQKLIPKIHIKADTPEPPLSVQSPKRQRAPDDGQPYRLSLLHALASACEDPDIKLLPLLSKGVPTGALSELPRSMQWPPKEHADLPNELTECIGNWKAAGAEPDTVSPSLAQGHCGRQTQCRTQKGRNHAWS